MKKAALGILVICLCLMLLGASDEIEPVPPMHNFYVNDYAQSIYRNHLELMLNTSRRLYEDTGVQVVMLSVDSLHGLDISDYSRLIVKNWGIGGENGRDGVLILISTSDKLCGTSLGESLEGAITDESIYENMLSSVRNGNYSKAAMDAYRRIIPDIYAFRGIAPDKGLEARLNAGNMSGGSGFAYGGMVLFVMALFIMLRSFRVSSKYRARFRYKGYQTKKYATSGKEREENLSEIRNVNEYDKD